MKHFILTKSSSLLFMENEYIKGETVPESNQVRYSGENNNSKLVRCSDGHWYIKNGKEMHRLKSIESKEVSIAKLTEVGGDIIAKVNKKWFLENRKEEHLLDDGKKC